MMQPGTLNPVFFTVGTGGMLMSLAYNIPLSSSRIIGGPSWTSSFSKMYAVEAKISDETLEQMQTMSTAARAEKVRLMMQSLLADRFHLKAHIETRTLPTYEIVIAKGGPKLPSPQPETVTAGPMEVVLQGGISIRNATVSEILKAPWYGLGDRAIINKTGLTGKYNLTLHWIPDIPGPSTAPGHVSVPEGQSSIFTAFEEQLGLKIVPSTGPVDVLVVDSIDLPSDN